MSILSYLIEVYGGCSGYLDLLSATELCSQAHHETSLLTSTSELLKQCNWLSIRQLVFYHSVTLLHKTLQEMRPEYIFKMLKPVSRRETRMTDQLCLQVENLKTTTTNRTFLPRTIEHWNMLPYSIREIRDKSTFKRRLREYVKNKVPVK